MSTDYQDNGVNERTVDSVRTVISKKGQQQQQEWVNSEQQHHQQQINFEKQGSEEPSIHYEEDDDTECKTESGEQEAKGNDAQEEPPAPDGGYGWLIVIGAFLVQVTSYGTTTSWGVMQDYYQQNVFGNDYPNVALQLSFVGTLCLIFSNCMGPFAQILQSYIGTRGVLFIGTMFIAVGLIIAGFSYQIWHLYLTQGVCFGIGVSFMYVTIMSVAPQYFTRKRGVALGIISSGSGIGGLIIPFIMTPINQSLGAGWTYRILGFICLACDLIATALVKERVPRSRKQHKKRSDIIKFEVLKDINFGIWCAGAALQLMAYFQPFFFLPSYATWIGLSDSQGSSLVAVASAMNFLGRILCGFVADRIGPLNANILFILMSALSTLLIWTFAFNYGVLMAYSVVFGLFCGSYFAQLSPITAAILGMERFPTGLSLVLLFNCFAVFGPNIASGIEGAVNSQPFLTYKMFTGVVFLAAAVVMAVLRFRMQRKFFAKV